MKIRYMTRTVDEREKTVRFDMMVAEETVIDRIVASTVIPNVRIDICEVWICDRQIFRGPYHWFQAGGMELPVYTVSPLRIIIVPEDPALVDAIIGVHCICKEHNALHHAIEG